MIFRGKEIKDFTDQELIEERDLFEYLGNYAIDRKKAWKDGGVKVKPPVGNGDYFTTIKTAIADEIKSRGI